MAQHAAPRIDADWRVLSIKTDLSFLKRWERAKSIEPRSLDFAHVLVGTMRDDGRIDLSVAVMKHVYEHLTATRGKDAALGLEANMVHEASEILRDVEIEEAFLKIPQGTKAKGKNTVTVEWSLADAVDCYEAVLAAGLDARKIKIIRLKREGWLATLAITLPRRMLDAARREYSPALDAPGFGSVVLDVIMRSIGKPETKDENSGAKKILDDEIPF